MSRKKYIFQRDQRLPIIPKIAKFTSKLALGFFFLTFLMGAQPSVNFPPTKGLIVKAEDAPIQTQQLISNALPFATQLPHPGYISTYFSSYHPGIDLATGLGMPIHPIADGVVISASYSLVGYGLNVIIDHGYGYTSLYAHMGQVYVHQGQKVSRDDYLGTVGLTGRTTGPHTHLEITKDGVKIDPLPMLPPVRQVPQTEDFTPVAKSTPITPPKRVVTTPAPIQKEEPKEEKKITFSVMKKKDLFNVLPAKMEKDSNLEFTAKLLSQTKVTDQYTSFQGGSYLDYLHAVLEQKIKSPINIFNWFQNSISKSTKKNI